MNIFKRKPKEEPVVMSDYKIYDITESQCPHEIWGISCARHAELSKELDTVVVGMMGSGINKDPQTRLFEEGLKLAKNEQERLYLVWKITSAIMQTKLQMDREGLLPDSMKNFIKTDDFPHIQSPTTSGKFTIDIKDKKDFEKENG
jgi:hypothetical protein